MNRKEFEEIAEKILYHKDLHITVNLLQEIYKQGFDDGAYDGCLE